MINRTNNLNIFLPVVILASQNFSLQTAAVCECYWKYETSSWCEFADYLEKNKQKKPTHPQKNQKKPWNCFKVHLDSE